jgi:hypothetical protein
MMMWFVTLASLLLACIAWIKARRTSRRLEQLSQMYWELKYQHSELRAQIERSGIQPASMTGAPPDRPGEAFVPLASLRR